MQLTTAFPIKINVLRFYHSGRDRPQRVGVIPPLGAQVFAGAARVHGEEGGQDIRYGWCQGGAAGPPAARRLPRAARAQRHQLARACAQQGR